MTFRHREDSQLAPRYVMAILDLTQRSDRALARTKRLRIVMICVWIALFILGVVVAFAFDGGPFLQVLAFGAMVAGVLDLVFAAGGLIRVVDEQRARAAQREAEARIGRSGWDE